jgi:hypothetical protein
MDKSLHAGHGSTGFHSALFGLGLRKLSSSVGIARTTYPKYKFSTSALFGLGLRKFSSSVGIARTTYPKYKLSSNERNLKIMIRIVVLLVF